jgi:hypothetical protein
VFQVKGASLLYMIPLERWNVGTQWYFLRVRYKG